MRIENQNQAARRKRSTKFCYICGEPLPFQGQARRGEVTTDHVIPRSLLGEPPPSDPWPIVLNVHARCEKLKQKHDHWISLYYRLTEDPRQKIDRLLSERNRSSSTILDSGRAEALLQELFSEPKERLETGHYRFLPLKVDPSPPFSVEHGTVALAEFQQVATGITLWIGGLHTFLYGDVARFISEPLSLPSETVIGNTPNRTPAMMSEHNRIIRGILDVADCCGRWDEITAWGKKVSYKCTWFWVPEMPECARCLWRLSLPRDLSRSHRESPFPGVSWYGVYELKCPPKDASTLGHEEFTRFNSFAEVATLTSFSKVEEALLRGRSNVEAAIEKGTDENT